MLAKIHRMLLNITNHNSWKYVSPLFSVIEFFCLLWIILCQPFFKLDEVLHVQFAIFF